MENNEILYADGDGDYEMGQTAFDIILLNPGNNRIAIIKEIRDICGCGLKDADEMIKQISFVRMGVSKIEAEVIKNRLENKGASVEVK